MMTLRYNVEPHNTHELPGVEQIKIQRKQFLNWLTVKRVKFRPGTS